MAMTCMDVVSVNIDSTKLKNGIKAFLSNEHFNQLEGLMNLYKEKKGSFLYWEGDEADKLYYIKSGKVKILKSTEDGKDLIISIMSSGDLIGEYGGCEDPTQSFSAEVIEHVEVGVISTRDLEQLLMQNGSFAIQFMKWFSLMNQRNQSKFRDLLLFGKAGALASTLIRMSNSYGVVTQDGIRLNVKLTNTEIGEFIGMTRESVNRFLSSWKEDGTLDVQNGKIIIKKLNNLRLICQCPTYPACPKEICRL